MATKSTFEIICRNSTGGDDKTKISGTHAEQTDAGQLRIYDGEEQVGGFISVVSWKKVEASS
jgi:hypothetical protein